jgi:hypothetical protein
MGLKTSMNETILTASSNVSIYDAKTLLSTLSPNNLRFVCR